MITGHSEIVIEPDVSGNFSTAVLPGLVRVQSGKEKPHQLA